jgi:hypothetical protein
MVRTIVPSFLQDGSFAAVRVLCDVGDREEVLLYLTDAASLALIGL